MSKWNDIKEKLILVEGWARDGLTNERIADNLGINQDTLYTYKKKYPEFSEALKKGKFEKLHKLQALKKRDLHRILLLFLLYAFPSQSKKENQN